MCRNDLSEKKQVDAQAKYGKDGYHLTDEQGLRNDPLFAEYASATMDCLLNSDNGRNVHELDLIRNEFDGSKEETGALKEAIWLTFLESYPHIFYWANSDVWKKEHFCDEVAIRKIWHFYKELSPTIALKEQVERSKYKKMKAMPRTPDPRIYDTAWCGPGGTWSHD